MAKPYDVTPKTLAESFPYEWPRLLGWPSPQVSVIDADVSTVSGAADKVFRIGGSKPWLLLLEFLTSYKRFVPERLHWHSTLVGHRHKMRVRSVLVLLEPEADGPAMSGEYQEQFTNEEPYVQFRYRVVRLWEIPAATLINAGPGLAVFAPLGQVESGKLIDTVRSVRDRLKANSSPKDTPDLLASMYILMGMRYDESVIDMVKKEIPQMRESVTYQIIREEGKVEEAREFIILIGTERFGAPDAATRKKLQGVSDLDQLHKLGARLTHVDSWKELLAKPR